MRFREISQEVFAADDVVVRIGSADIGWLKERLQKAPRGRVRICAHRNSGDPLHEMIIVLAQSTYIRPHKHLDKSESFHLIEGMVDVVALNDAGEITKIIPLGALGTDRDFYYRLEGPVFHTLLIRSPLLIIHETTNGPFNRSDTIFASWAPEETDTVAAKAFVADLAQRVERFANIPRSS